MSVKGRQFTGKMENNVSTLRDQYIFATLGKTGSGRVSLDTIGRKFAEVSTGQIVEANSTDNILVKTGHGAKEGWLIRITSSTNPIIEEEILIDEIIDADTIKLSAFLSNTLEAGDTYDLYKPVFERVAPDGSSLATVVSPPLQIIKNGVIETVEDSTNPLDVVAIPVLIKAVDGTNITINAGDINIQTSAEGVNFDSTRIGDGTGKYAAITTDLDMQTHDSKVYAELVTLNATDLATEATLDAIKTSVELMDDTITNDGGTPTTKFQAIGGHTGVTAHAWHVDNTGNGRVDVRQSVLPTGASTEAKQDTQITRLNLLATESKQDTQITRLNLLATESKQDTQITRLNLLATESKQDTTITAIGTTNTNLGAQADSAATTDTGSFSVISFIKRGMQNWTTLFNRIPVIGQGLKTTSIPVVLAADSDNLNVNESNTTGQISKGTQTASTSATINAPTGATGFMIKNHLESAGTLYWEIGGTANSSSNDLSSGQGSAFVPCKANVSIFAGADGDCKYAIQWLIK